MTRISYAVSFAREGLHRKYYVTTTVYRRFDVCFPYGTRRERRRVRTNGFFFLIFSLFINVPSRPRYRGLETHYNVHKFMSCFSSAGTVPAHSHSVSAAVILLFLLLQRHEYFSNNNYVPRRVISKTYLRIYLDRTNAIRKKTPRNVRRQRYFIIGYSGGYDVNNNNILFVFRRYRCLPVSTTFLRVSDALKIY